MTGETDIIELAQNLAQNAWVSYREELQGDGFEPRFLDALEGPMCEYISATWAGGLAGVNRHDGQLVKPETIGGYDGNYIDGRSNKEVRDEILKRGEILLAGKDGRRLGGRIRAGRIRNVCENWSTHLSNTLEDKSRGELIDKYLIRMIGSDLERYSQKMMIEDPKLLEW